MPQIPAAIPTQAFELIRNRIAEILVDELPEQATLQGDAQLNATVYVERFVTFDLTELPAVNVSINRTAYSEQTQRSTDGEHTFSIDVHASAKSTISVRGDSLAMFRLQKLLGVVRGVLEDSRYKTLGFAPPFIESRKVTAIEYAQPTEGDGTSTVVGRITFVVRAPDRSGVVTPELIAGYDTQVKLGLTEKGYVFTGDNIPVPPIVGAEISVNGTFYIDAEAGDEVDIPVVDSDGNPVGDVTAASNVTIDDSEVTLKDTGGNVLDTVSVLAEGSSDIIAPDATVTVNSNQFGTVPSGGTLDVEVVSSADNPVGGIISGQVVISNNATFINGVQVTDQEAEVNANISVELDGNPSGSWNPGAQTWEVTSAPCASANLQINGVQSEVIASGATFNLIATLDGIAGGTYNAATDTLSFTSNAGWIRNPDWPAMPTPSVEQFIGLLAVFENRSNRISMEISGVALVDYGDGSTINSNGTPQTKTYNYATIAQPVYVDPVTGLNYKMVFVTVTRIAANITTFNIFGIVHWLDIYAALPNATVLSWSAVLSGTRPMYLCERVRILTIAAGFITPDRLIVGCYGLKVFEFPYNTPNNIINLVSNTGPIYDLGNVTTSAATGMNGAFSGSLMLKAGTITNNIATSWQGLFDGCNMLESVTSVVGAACTSALIMFRNCRRLRGNVTVNMPLLQNVAGMFQFNNMLQSVIFVDASAINNTGNLFDNCYYLGYLEMNGCTRGFSISGTAIITANMAITAASIGTASGAQTITVTGTPFGADLLALNPVAVAVAGVMTGKGYTVAN